VAAVGVLAFAIVTFERALMAQIYIQLALFRKIFVGLRRKGEDI
jgi:hypothetical protein